MKIFVEISGILKSPRGEKKFSLTFSKQKTVGEILAEIGYDERSIKMILPSINKKSVDKDFTPAEGDTLYLFLPVGGG
jgi:hypothetical protein